MANGETRNLLLTVDESPASTQVRQLAPDGSSWMTCTTVPPPGVNHCPH